MKDFCVRTTNTYSDNELKRISRSGYRLAEICCHRACELTRATLFPTLPHATTYLVCIETLSVVCASWFLFCFWILYKNNWKSDNIMGPKKNGVSQTVLTIKTKQEIIANVESGQKSADVARQYGLNRSTVCTILAKKDIIKKTQAAKGVTKITSAKQRCEKMERLLLVWINEREMKRDVTSMAIIQEKAREIFEWRAPRNKAECVSFRTRGRRKRTNADIRH